MNKHAGISLVGITCREASRLASEALDRELSRRERWALRVHTFLCRSCRRFAKQAAILHEAAALMPAQLRQELFAETTRLSATRREKIKRLLADAATSE
ncbi:MAG: zf-HC2 domain-containing protein [Bythopirellula sp.]|nr:zf-HC2 domain-containing protein [Bythopirellula sp.]